MHSASSVPASGRSTYLTLRERNQAIFRMHSAGASIVDLSERFALSRQSIYLALRKANQQTTHSREEKSLRNETVREAFLAGVPMTKIAETCHLTRQGVQLILKKFKLTGRDGGASVRSSSRKTNKLAARQARMEERTQEKWGCSYTAWLELRSMADSFHQTPIARFIQHRSNALRDGIPWDLTLSEWWGVWKASGKYAERGRKKHQYCMSRSGDSGTFSLGNVHVTTAAENLKDGFANRQSCKAR